MPITQLPTAPVVWPLNKQAVELPNSKEPGYSGIYVNAAIPEFSTSETIYDLFAVGKGKGENAPYLGRRPWDPVKRDFASHYVWSTYAEVEELRTAVGSALTKLVRDGALGQGLPEAGWTTAMWIANRPEFQIVEHASAAYSRRTVALYESYDAETAYFILEHSEAVVIFTTSSHVPTLLSGKANLPLLKLIVTLDPPAPAPTQPGELGKDQLLRQWAKTKDVAMYTWDEFLDFGRANLFAHNPPKTNEEIAGFCYTSGTTGKPKGALIAHRQLAIAGSAVALQFEGTAPVMLSYLPLAHIYERMLECFITRLGGAIGYGCGDPLRITEDAQILKPEFFPGVPRVFNRIAAGIQAGADAGGLKGKLLSTALASKIANHDETGSVTHAFYDRVVFRKVRDVLGGRVKFMCSGSAPIRPDVLKLLRVAFSVDFREGYGQTENAGACLFMNPNDKVLGTVGVPFPGLSLKFRSVPEMGYDASLPLPSGEILSRGQTIFKGYYKDEKKTAETLLPGGWMASGDVGSIDEAGRVKIIDRVKNLIKLSQGEYIAVENVEGLLSSTKYLAQFLLHGDSTESHVVGVGVVEPEAFAALVAKVKGQKIAPTDVAALEAACKDKDLIHAVLEDITRLGKEAKLKGYEFVRALALRVEPFSQENGLLTPTFKVQRGPARKILGDIIDDLYKQPLHPVGSTKASKL